MVEKDDIINIKQRILDGWIKTRQARKDIHVSTILHCKRRSCAEILGESEPLKERTFRSYLLGSAIHRELQAILGPDFEYEKEISHPKFYPYVLQQTV